MDWRECKSTLEQVEVLQKVKALSLIPQLSTAVTQQVADFFETDIKVVQK